jgi:hypothetical protein
MQGNDHDAPETDQKELQQKLDATMAECVRSLKSSLQAAETAYSVIAEASELANVDLQNFLQRSQQATQLISNISKQLFDTNAAIIRASAVKLRASMPDMRLYFPFGSGLSASCSLPSLARFSFPGVLASAFSFGD